MEKIKIIDCFRRKEEHLIFNFYFIKLIGEIEIEKKIYFYGKKSHIDTLKKEEYLEIIYRKKFGIEKNGKINMLFNYIISAFWDVYIYIYSKDSRLCFLAINPLSFGILRIFNKILKKDIWMVFHGELEFLIKTPQNKWYRYLSTLFRKQFYLDIEDNINYIVLGESIKENLKKYDIKKKVYYLDHPYKYPIKTKKIKKLKKLRIGTVGIANIEKGTHNIILLEKKLKKYLLANKLELNIIGKVCFEIDADSKINYLKDNLFLEREEFERRVEELDYIVYFYSIDSYKLMASGAFFDALAFEKPILGLRNDFFEYYFNKYGNMGYLFDSIEEMTEKLKEILFEENNDYDIFINNIKNAKNGLSEKEIKKQIKEWW